MTTANLNEQVTTMIGYDLESGNFLLPPEVVPDVQTAIATYQLHAAEENVPSLSSREDGSAQIQHSHLNAVIGGLHLVWRMQRDVPERAARTWRLANDIGVAALKSQREIAFAMLKLSQELPTSPNPFVISTKHIATE